MAIRFPFVNQQVFKIIWYLPCYIAGQHQQTHLIHLNPAAAERPRLSLFQRDLILAHRELEPTIANVI